IEDTLDETFARGDAHERAARVRDVVKLIASEEDPTVRAMAEAHADNIAQRIGLPDAASFRLLRESVTRALAEASQRASTAPAQNVAPPAARDPYAPRPTSDISPWRARSRDQRADIGLAIFGCFLDFPDLLGDPEGQEAILELEGDVALAVAT